MAGKMQNYREEAISTERLTAKLQDEHASFYLAELDSQILAGVMVFARGNRAWYFYGGSSNQKREFMASYLAQWQS
ncbi:MAG: peptidoglycan bridge formation glycyltransferase FemA/FemB family protein [Chitinophagaceae bacterium]|nr:peptidoglycan bridge formation glycyltransferase FemA/FemB family protein [Chitinophagaceae bacterium]